MGSKEGVSIGSADHGRHLSAKQVVHDTGTLLEAVQPREQRLQQRTQSSGLQRCCKQPSNRAERHDAAHPDAHCTWPAISPRISSAQTNALVLAGYSAEINCQSDLGRSRALTNFVCSNSYLDRCAVVGRMQCSNLLVAELRHRAQHDGQVAAHVGVRAIVHMDVWHLCKCLRDSQSMR